MSTPKPKPLAVAVGDPAGVGPMVAASGLQKSLGADRALLFGDAIWLQGALVRTLARLSPESRATIPPGMSELVDVGSWPEEVIDARAPTVKGGEIQRRILDAACEAVLEGRARALVTGPMSKEAVVKSGTEFSGQTEHLARLSGVDPDDVTMMFIGPTLRVALVTTHWPIAKVPAAITPKRVRRTVLHLVEVLKRLQPKDNPLIIQVTGVNPHAGEGGTLGREEIDVVSPVLDSLRNEPPFSSGEVKLVGPSPAEAVLRFAAAGEIHGVVAMFHDQATIASKLLDWGQAVNLTWGLPFVRTSVDHGVAYDAAAKGVADDSGMCAAIRLAQTLTAAQ